MSRGIPVLAGFILCVVSRAALADAPAPAKGKLAKGEITADQGLERPEAPEPSKWESATKSLDQQIQVDLVIGSLKGSCIAGSQSEVAKEWKRLNPLLGLSNQTCGVVESHRDLFCLLFFRSGPRRKNWHCSWSRFRY